MHTDELSKNAMGGTELMGHALYRHVSPELLDKFQIIRSRARELDPNKPRIFWLHDMAGDGEVRHLSTKEGLDRYTKLVFVSNWQQQSYNTILGVPYSRGVVLENAIVPISPADKPDDGTIRLIYHSTPHRGLEILVPVFKHLADKYPITLDVYSSFNLYGWAERDKQYEKLFQECKDHPKINYHGTQPNDVIREALQRSHIFPFPSIWQETSCLCLMEAMSAKVLCVHPNLAALPETSGGLTLTYPWTEDVTDHANRFVHQLERAIKFYIDHREPVLKEVNMVKIITDHRFDWRRRSIEWTNFLEALLPRS